MDNCIVDGSILSQVDETFEFVKKNLHVRFEITDAPQRREVWDYPLPALREAIINAIVHRDYGDTADIQIKIFEDTLQVWSPGFLPYNMTVEYLLDPDHSSKPRNKLIAQVFYDLGLIERYGSGIKRILDACRDAGMPQPVFENFSGGFRIKFILNKAWTGGSSPGTGEFTAPSNVPLNAPLNVPINVPLIMKVAGLIQEFPGVQRKILAAKLKVTEKTIGRAISSLSADGKIERRGSKKTGGYFPVATNIHPKADRREDR